MKHKKFMAVALVAAVLAGGFAAQVLFRAKRAYEIARDWRAQIRYVRDSGGTIGEVPASQTFASSYLEAIFGSDPDLLSQLKDIISKGLAEDAMLNLGEVTAMIVTYQKGADGKVENVAAQILGSFKLGARKPGFHREGFFAQQVDRNLWETGNTMLSMFGRDSVVFADPKVAHMYDEIRTGIFGDKSSVAPLVSAITNKPFYFTAVLPDPHRVLASQLRPHIQAVIIKGHLEPVRGNYDVTLLTKDPKSCSYTFAVMSDLRLAAGLMFKGPLDGVAHKTAWGNMISTWWSYEMAKTLDAAVMERQQNIVSIKTDFERTMVNATIKTIERMGRDMAAMRMMMDEKLDPRLADARLKSNKPSNYWSDPHEWGPDWPFPPTRTNQSAVAASSSPTNTTAPAANTH